MGGGTWNPGGAWRRDMTHGLTLFFVLVALLPASAASASAPIPVRLEADTQHVSLPPHTRFREEGEERLEADRAFDIVDSGGFEMLPGDNPAFGFKPRPHWFHLRLQNLASPQSDWLLVLEYALLDSIEVYVRDPEGSITRQQSGDLWPFSERAIRHRHPNFAITLEQGRYADVLIRVETQSSMQVPLSLWLPATFSDREREAALGVGLYYGILIALLLYNLVLFGSLRDASYLYYVLHISAFGLVMLCLNGLAFQYLWPDSPELANLAVPISIAVGMAAMLQFARHFLELRRLVPRGNQMMLALMIAMGIVAFAAPLLPYRLAVLLGTGAVFPCVAVVLVCAVMAARRGYQPARWFLLAWSALLLGTLAYASVSFGLLPKNFFTEYGIQIGSGLEMILLSFALAYRYAALRNENEEIVREAKGQLESRVEARTLELSSALAQLSEANGRLREFNRRDGLTGVFNRRHFEDELLRATQDAQRAAGVLSLIMIDIDHFKSVNDTHGHLVGDDCLRRVAKIIDEIAASERGIVARYGGEEFAIILPDRDVAAALALAERIRHRVANTPLHSEGKTVAITVSLGVAEIRNIGVATDPAEALRRADRALYSAKQCGRNRVQLGTEMPT